MQFGIDGYSNMGRINALYKCAFVFDVNFSNLFNFANSIFARFILSLMIQVRLEASLYLVS